MPHYTTADGLAFMADVFNEPHDFRLEVDADPVVEQPDGLWQEGGHFGFAATEDQPDGPGLICNYFPGGNIADGQTSPESSGITQAGSTEQTGLAQEQANGITAFVDASNIVGGGYDTSDTILWDLGGEASQVVAGTMPQSFYWCLNPNAQSSAYIFDDDGQFLGETFYSPDDPVFLDIGAKQLSGGYGGHGGLGLTYVGGNVDLDSIRGGEEFQDRSHTFEAVAQATDIELQFYDQYGRPIAGTVNVTGQDQPTGFSAWDNDGTVPFMAEEPTGFSAWDNDGTVPFMIEVPIDLA